MSLTIHEVLQNAQYNLENNGEIGRQLAIQQLQTAMNELDTGKTLYDEIEE